ncbi:MAG: type IX secretion system protein PorD [Bacteroidota bacterium]
MRRIIVFILLISFATVITAQELNCKIQVLSQQVQGTDKRAFESMQTAIYEFMNNKKWTNDAFKNDERIDCSILINITERIGDDFRGTLQIQSRRPVFKSSYNSVLLNFNDNDIQFRYIESQPFEFNDNTYSSELTSILGFYAYLIIGLDYDSFALNGGTPHLQKALAAVNNAQNSSAKGWKAFDSDQNRYWLINNMLDASFIPLRECMYNYHRKGLDVMTDNKEASRVVIFESIESIRKVHQIKPLSFSTQVFFNAKSDEIINVFSGAFADEKSKVVNLLNEIDPTNSNKYQKILQ